MRVTLLPVVAATLAGCTRPAAPPRLPHNTFVRFSSVGVKDASSVRDTIIRNAIVDTFVIHLVQPDSCLRPNPPPPCPPLPLLDAVRTDTIIR